MLWEQRVGGSNPSAPTIRKECGTLVCGAWPLIDFIRKVGDFGSMMAHPEVTNDGSACLYPRTRTFR
jgi:hypothetical protein